jgi:hypothetical protein
VDEIVTKGDVSQVSTLQLAVVVLQGGGPGENASLDDVFGEALLTGGMA